MSKHNGYNYPDGQLDKRDAAKAKRRSSSPKLSQEFVDVHLTDDDKQQIREYEFTGQYLFEFIHEMVVKHEYKLSIALDKNGLSVGVFLSGNANHPFNPGKTVSARGPHVSGALTSLFHKIDVYLGYEEWTQSETQDELWG